ncbi:Protein argonaute 16 [Ranunculus cassubicifolius]
MEKVESDEKERTVKPPPPLAPTEVKPEELLDPPKRVPISRIGSGKDGRLINLIANHFRVSVTIPDAVFFQYSVSIKSKDNQVIVGKHIGRKVMDRMYQIYYPEMAGKHFAYDGEKALYTVGPLPLNEHEFMVVLEEAAAKCNGSPGLSRSPSEIDCKRIKHSFQSTVFNVEISFAAKIPIRPIALALKGLKAENTGDALRVFDIILRQQAAKRGCLLVGQSFFHDDVRNFVDVGGGVTACRGFHSSFRTTQGGLSLNMDVSSTMILTPGPVLDFILTNQNLKDPRQIDWGKAKKMLKNLRVKARHNNMEFKITGLSEKPCNQQFFPLKRRSEDGTEETINITVYDYFANNRNIQLSNSAYMPCLDVGKPKRPNYLPLELCSLVSLQRYTKVLSSLQRASLLEKSRQKPLERVRTVTDAVKNHSYDDDPILKACGVSIEKQLVAVEGRVLNAPTLKVGNSESCAPRNGRWNFNQKKLLSPVKIDHWAIVNFSSSCDTSHLCRELIDCGRNKGMHIERPHSLTEEDSQWTKSGPVARVEKMFEKIRAKLPGPPTFLLCVLPERKNCDIYGPWKKKNLHEVGIVTQCISPLKINDQYLTNVLLKINTKLGGINSLLAVEHMPSIPLLKDIPTMILGMDVSHGSPGQSDVPSIAAVVGSRSWPLISRYSASVRTQSSKVEMIDSLFKILPNGEDDGMIRELLVDFRHSSQGRKPEQIIIFRDGVSESQFDQVLNIELEQVIKTLQHLGESKMPKFTVIVAQKNHHTKLFQANDPNNVPPGTVVDTGIVHPKNYDFYMCAHNGMIGTSRPAHYHVLLDEIGFSTDALQNLVHSLSYVYQRSTSAVSVVAPICYAHLAAAQMSQFMKFEDSSSSSSPGDDGVTSPAPIPVPELPRLHKNIQNTMFFC